MLVSRPGLDSYPSCLDDLAHRPASLYMLGDSNLLSGRLIGIVGTREPTPYGLRTARSLGAALSRAGACVVSGMARGIDAAAHRSALGEPGRTIAVLGTGIDVPYPAGHAELHRVIAQDGLVVSESGPGARAHKGAFPRRNRIIAALCPLTIVVEAGHRSGALNTAAQAIELGRIVASVPGPIDSPQSEGTNQLIRDGASVIATIDDALSLAGLTRGEARAPVQLSDVDGQVWSALSRGAMTIDRISARTSLSARDCLTAVTSLELHGMVESLLTGEVRRRVSF